MQWKDILTLKYSKLFNSIQNNAHFGAFWRRRIGMWRTSILERSFVCPVLFLTWIDALMTTVNNFTTESYCANSPLSVCCLTPRDLIKYPAASNTALSKIKCIMVNVQIKHMIYACEIQWRKEANYMQWRKEKKGNNGSTTWIFEDLLSAPVCILGDDGGWLRRQGSLETHDRSFSFLYSPSSQWNLYVGINKVLINIKWCSVLWIPLSKPHI